ncbi:phosphoglycerate dehydrogenase-like enzyme [Mumia flava]|uniref:Phosphoglycerate dehydrogenase-like enzyme n=2 Tax=Mumia flava TaxID=1348852 RepID=A0A2M9B868_9ACTN|nr:phosphoglycerate dehydrogenase-like enzyme [Mumia flava]
MMPFRPDELGPLPTTYSFTRYDGGARDAAGAGTLDQVPDDIEDVELWVLPYGLALPIDRIVPRMPRLRVIQAQSAGTDGIAHLIPDGVTLCNARGVHDSATAELGVGLIIASMRRIPDFVRAQDRGEWLPFRQYGALADKRVLIVGYGSIGEALERRLEGFEVDVVRVARRAREGVHPITDLPDLLPDADVVVMLTPLTDATRHLVGPEFLAAMKDDTLLVNLARGPIVDTEALLAELGTGRLRAALDVTDPEPLPDGHPLWSAPGLLISPHVAGGTSAMRPRVLRLVTEQLRRFASGEPLLNRVDASPT